MVSCLLAAIVLALAVAPAPSTAEEVSQYGIKVMGVGRIYDQNVPSTLDCNSPPATPQGEEGNRCVAGYAPGSSVTWVAEAPSGWAFSGWRGVRGSYDATEQLFGPLHCEGADETHFLATASCSFSVPPTATRFGAEAIFEDVEDPDTAIESGPSPLEPYTSARFTFSSSEPGSTFLCSLDRADPTACSSPNSYFGLSDGDHLLEVWATDPSGRRDLTPASRTWRVDTTPPETTILSGPASGSASMSRDATFEFASEVDARFRCRLDSGTFQSCSGPGDSHSITGLGPGKHTFYVRATDTANNIDPTPATRTWTVLDGRTASSITLSIRKTTTAVIGTGAVMPAHPSSTVTVTLFRKQNGIFVKLAAKTLTLDDASNYSATFNRPRAGTCKMRSRFPADSDHTASTKSVTFTC
jgi:hypothetical protein